MLTKAQRANRKKLIIMAVLVLLAAAVLCAHLIPGLLAGRWKRVLFCPTGALLSPTSTQQGESIPGVCHAVALEGGH